MLEQFNNVNEILYSYVSCSLASTIVNALFAPLARWMIYDSPENVSTDMKIAESNLCSAKP